jgi:hypothetical protein
MEKVLKNLLRGIFFLVGGLCIYHSDFLHDFEENAPHLAWDNMSGWFIHVIVIIYNLFSVGLIVFGSAMLLVLTIKQTRQFISVCKRSFRS